MAKVSCRKAVTMELERLAQTDPAIYMICSDSRGSVTATGFAQAYPERFIEVGIAEQNAVGIGAGLAATGKTVFVASPACFLAARSYEQIKVDVAYNKANVKLIGVSAGVSYGPLGGTHTALHDFACMRALPNLEIFAPADATCAGFLTSYLAKSGKPAYMRTGRGDVQQVYPEGEQFEIGKAKLVCAGSHATVIACGETVFPAKQAAALLAREGIYIRVLDLFTIKPIDAEAVIQAARETRAIVTVEEHSVMGGLGEQVAHLVVQTHPVRMTIMGFPDEEYKVGGSAELFGHYGLTPESIAAEVKKLL